MRKSAAPFFNDLVLLPITRARIFDVMEVSSRISSVAATTAITGAELEHIKHAGCAVC